MATQTKTPARAAVAAGNGAVIAAADLEPLLDGAPRRQCAARPAPALDTRRRGIVGQLNKAFNDLAQTRERTTDEIVRVATVIGREGRLTDRAEVKKAEGTWRASLDAVNAMIDDLSRPTLEVARVIDAVAEGDLSQKMQLKIEGRAVKGEFLRIGTTVNSMVDQLSSFADEVTRVAREVGTEGKLGGQATGEGRLRHVEGPDRQRERHGDEPDEPGAQHRRGDDGGGERRPDAARSRSTSRARCSSSRTRSTRWSTSCRPSPTRSRASRARPARRGSSAARPS